MGVGVPGPVGPEGIVNGCVNLGWGVTPVERELSRLLDGLPVRAANDANAAALGEVWQGAGTGARSLLLVTLGTGVGAGIVVNGVILTGAHGSGGEIGHIQVNPGEGGACRCGKAGCLEQYASATGIVRLARRRGWTGDPTAKAVLDAARAGDAIARLAAEEAGRWLGLALSYVACAVDPEVILLGGGVARPGRCCWGRSGTSTGRACSTGQRRPLRPGRSGERRGDVRGGKADFTASVALGQYLPVVTGVGIPLPC